MNTGHVPVALGSRHPDFTPFQVFETKDGYVAAAVKGGVNDQWPLFCAVIGRVDIIDDPRFSDGWTRTQNYADLEPIMTTAFGAKTTGQWLAELEAAGIACSPVNNIGEAAADPQVLAREMIVEIDQPGAGTFKTANTPFRFSRTQGEVAGHAPELGEHTAEVLSGLLGLEAEEIIRLRDAHVI